MVTKESAKNRLIAASVIVSVALLGLTSGCNSATPPVIAEAPVISDPMISDPTPQQPGKEVGISIDVSSVGGVTMNYTWNADGGEIVRGQGSPAITYRVPDEPGTYNIRVKVEWDGQSVEKATSIEVEGEPVIPTGITKPSPTPTFGPSAPVAEITDTPVPAWELGELIYEETFEDEVISGLETKFGTYDIVRTSDGNHVWRTSTQGASELTLPTSSNNYAVEVKIMQVSDKRGFGGIYVRAKTGGCPGYQFYMDTFGGWLNLVEKAASCDELRETGLFANYSTNLSNETWYTFRMEVKETEVRVYRDGQLVLRDKDIDGTVLQSNIIGFWACCEDLLPYTFDFDDIRVWQINP